MAFILLMIEAGDLDGAASLIVRAEAIARSIGTPNDQNSALAVAAEAAAKAGDLDRADTPSAGPSPTTMCRRGR